jgi:predicted DNA binding protein/GAF domain-containing protein
MSQTSQSTDRDLLTLKSGAEALQSRPEFNGPVESMDGHHCNDHFALVYESQQEQLQAIVPFLRQGIERGERCMYVVDELSEQTLLAALRDGGVDVDAALDSGQLSFHSVEETYLRNQTFDPDEMIDFYAEAVERATEEYTALRVVAETTWLQREVTTTEQFLEYEAKINDLFEDEDCIALCQYDRSAFEPEIIKDIIQTHPHLIYEGTVCNNLYHTPPEEYFAPDEPVREVERMMGTLLGRTRARVALEDRQRYQRQLYEITSDPDRTFREKLQALFALGCEVFDMDFGAIARVDSETDSFEIEQTSGTHGEIKPGTSLELSETYCTAVTGGDTTASVSAPVEDGFGDIAFHREFGFRAYVGTSLSLDSGAERTFFFVSSEPRSEPISESERTFHYLMSQWVESELERQQRETQLAALNEMSRSLMDAETLSEIAETTVEHADDSLQLPLTAVATYEKATGKLTPTAETPRAADDLPLAPLCDGTSAPIWEAFVSNEIATIDGSDYPSLTAATELIAVPLAQQGVLITATTSGGFTDIERDFVEMTAATVEAACTRADREQQLHEREETLEEQNTTLERLNRINNTIRNIDQALVQASTREEIEEAVCEQLASIGPYEMAWVGDHDAVTDEITPREVAGTEKGYLNEVTVATDETATGEGPGRKAVETREPQIVNSVLDDPSFEQWRQPALNRGYHACIALPLLYEETLYGALVIYAGQPGVFDEMEQAVLTEMGQTIAYAINAVESKKALISDEVTELEFVVEDGDMGINNLVRTTGCEVSLETLIPRSDGRIRALFSTRGAKPEDVLDFKPHLPVTDLTVASARREGDEPVCLFEATLSDDSLADIVLDHGGQLKRLEATEAAATITIDLAADAAVREFVDMFQAHYADAELTAQRTSQRPKQTSRGFRAAALDELTTRQLEVLQTAYFNGYFEEPRTRTASEVADTLDISQPTFTSHARTAQRKIFRHLFDEEPLTV